MAPVPKEKGPNLRITHFIRYSLKLCQIEVYEVSTEIYNELMKYFQNFKAVRPSAKSQSFCYIYLVRYIHDFYCESSDCKIYKTLC